MAVALPDAFGGFDGVGHEVGDGHGADAVGDAGDVGGDGEGGVEVDVAYDALAGLFGCVLGCVS